MPECDHCYTLVSEEELDYDHNACSNCMLKLETMQNDVVCPPEELD